MSMAPKVPDILPIHRWDLCLHPYLSSELLSLFEVLTMMEALLCQFPNSSIRKLLAAFNSCLLGQSLLEPSHHTVKKPKQPHWEVTHGLSSWQPQRRTSQQPASTAWCVNEWISKGFQPAAFDCPSWIPRYHDAAISHPGYALSEFLTQDLWV